MEKNPASSPSSFAESFDRLPPNGAVGVASALIDTVGPTQAVDLMVEHFGWDATMHAVVALDAPQASRVLYLVVQTLVTPTD